MEILRKVCVTGASGYIGSYLVNKLLHKGYTVHATLSNLEDKSKVGLLKSLPNAETNLVLFQVDIVNISDEFELAIEGCEYVFHVATPSENSQYKDITEATVAAAKGIAEACVRSKTVKRLIYTGTMYAASPSNEDGKSFKPFLDESCWTPFNLSFSYGRESVWDYMKAKTKAEQEILKYNEVENGKLEVVSLACGMAAGDTLHNCVPLTITVLNSQITGNSLWYDLGIMYSQQLIGSIPIVHIDDLCEAHIFCVEVPEIKGRFLCAAANVSSLDIASYFNQHYPEFKITDEFRGEAGAKTTMDNSKLMKMGFVYKHDMKKILDDSIKCERRFGGLFQLATN